MTEMKHIQVYQTIRNTTTVIVNKRRHGSVTPASLARLAQIVLTEQMLNNCSVIPSSDGKIGWTANIHKETE